MFNLRKMICSMFLKNMKKKYYRLTNISINESIHNSVNRHMETVK